jgi:periplasmic protein TonB
MIAIISVIVLVAVISLYEFFSARHWQQVTSAERNELVFANRNKEYGAYAIRRDYDMRVMLIVAAMVFAIGSAYGIYKFIQSLPEPEVPEAPIDTAAFTMQAPTLDEELDPPPPEEEVPPMERTVQFLPPVVSDDVPETQQVVSDEEVKVSTETNETDNESFEIVEKPREEKVVEPEEPKVYTYVDEPAEFPGGTAALKRYLAENMKYPQTAVELGLEGKCYLQFVVSASGNISNVTVQRGVPDCPECDKEAVRVVKSMPKWRPGKNGGKEVHSTFNLPVVFKLQ